MSLKQEIETWVAALARYDNNEFDDALNEFDKIGDTSKILFNMGVIHATLGEHEKAVVIEAEKKVGRMRQATGFGICRPEGTRPCGCNCSEKGA